MRIAYTGMKHGWVGFHIDDIETPYEFAASNVIIDCLFDLIDITIRLCEGEEEVFIEFWLEPASYLWHIVHKDKLLYIHHYFCNDSKLEIKINKNYLKGFSLEQTTETSLNIFADQVIRFFETLLTEKTLQEYQSAEAWKKEFPQDKFAKLKKLRPFLGGENWPPV